MQTKVGNKNKPGGSRVGDVGGGINTVALNVLVSVLLIFPLSWKKIMVRLGL